MLALTVKQPFAWAIVAGVKDVENRSWRPPRGLIGKRIWIHAGSQPHPLWEDLYGDIPVPPLAFGAILGSVTVADIVLSSPSRWFLGPIGWVLRDARMLKRPRSMPGRQGLWSYPSRRLA